MKMVFPGSSLDWKRAERPDQCAQAGPKKFLFGHEGDRSAHATGHQWRVEVTHMNGSNDHRSFHRFTLAILNPNRAQNVQYD